MRPELLRVYSEVSPILFSESYSQESSVPESKMVDPPKGVRIPSEYSEVPLSHPGAPTKRPLTGQGLPPPPSRVTPQSPTWLGEGQETGQVSETRPLISPSLTQDKLPQ